MRLIIGNFFHYLQTHLFTCLQTSIIENVKNVNIAFSYIIFTTADNLVSFTSIDDVHSYFVVHTQASIGTS